ncbi:hypothetical protein RBSWK_05123 [Rhodopirellula baltica SWK14]|uniref:Uncharacterized protein n=1 Tax=Rhodopirellula baltica SWK14 TaxID=993516 RepID=L7CB37_RHOBT|nr:hypothetical protein RBSWK_05123 [Rhodopirellula baltica SWK14]
MIGIHECWKQPLMHGGGFAFRYVMCMGVGCRNFHPSRNIDSCKS